MKVSTITATEANRSFSKLLEAVRRGESFEITLRGRKVAVLKPIESAEARRARQDAAVAQARRLWAEQNTIVSGIGL